MAFQQAITFFGLTGLSLRAQRLARRIAAPSSKPLETRSEAACSVRFEAISKHYEPTQAVLAGIDLEVKAGEFVVLVGPSGCGKSTLLRMLAGLENISAGRMWIADKVVNDLSPAQRDIAMVFQDYALYPHKTVYDNLAFGLQVRGASKAEIAERVHSVAAQLQITELLQRKPSALSGGQRQRVAIGRALARKARLFLFDEPLSNLDVKLRNEMRVEIKKLHQQFGMTTLYVTHDQVEAMTLGDRIAVMAHGQIEQYGTPEQVYQQPRTSFVATFLGSPSTNLLKLDLVSPKTKDQVTSATGVFLGTLFISLPDSLNSHGAQQLTLGIRPEKIKYITQASADPATTTLAQIEFIEPLGAETIVTLNIAGQLVRARWVPDAALGLGQSVNISIAAHDCLWFDTVSGLNLQVTEPKP